MACASNAQGIASGNGEKAGHGTEEGFNVNRDNEQKKREKKRHLLQLMDMYWGGGGGRDQLWCRICSWKKRLVFVLAFVVLRLDIKQRLVGHWRLVKFADSFAKPGRPAIGSRRRIGEESQRRTPGFYTIYRQGF